MNSNLRDAAANYDNEDNSGIHPISLTDGYIIDQLMTIIKKQKALKELSIILNQYKHIPDSSILEELRGFNETVKEDEEMVFIDFVTIGKESFLASFLCKIRPVEGWVDDEYKFSILLNEEPTPDRNNWMRNKYIHFESQQERDAEIDSLQKRLTSLLNVRFL